MTLRSRPSLPVAGLTVLLMTLLALTLIAGCGGSSGPSPAELAAQDKKVEAANRGAAAYARVVAVAQRLKRRRERRAVIRAGRVRRFRGGRRVTVLQRFASGDLCAPIRGGGPASRRGQRLLRRQMLYNLNLRC